MTRDGEAGEPQQLESEEFKQRLKLQLESSGIINSLKSQMRTQMLAQLQAKYAAGIRPPAEAPSLARRVINSLVADYMASSSYDYSLSVFQPESGLSGGGAVALTSEEVVQVMHLSRPTPLSSALSRRGLMPPPRLEAPSDAPQAGQLITAPKQCFLVALFESIKEINDRAVYDSATQTYEEGSFRLGAQLQMLEDRYTAQSQENVSKPFRAMEERMSAYRREVDERVRQEVAHQVERVRELEMSQVRLEEAAKYRRKLEGERQELEQIYKDRSDKLREREEAQSERLKRQQRDVEGAAFEHRQRIVKEEDRLRAWKAEVEAEAERRSGEARARMERVEAREGALAAREAEAERKNAEAAQLIALADDRARRKAREELLAQREELDRDRLALEADRARVLEQRAEITAELTGSRAGLEKLKAAEAAKAEAELRSSALEAELDTLKLKLEHMKREVQEAHRGGLGRMRSLNDASMVSAGSYGYLANVPSPGSPTREDLRELKDALRRSEASRKKAQREVYAARAELQQVAEKEFAAARSAKRLQSIVDEGIDNQEGALEVMEDMELAFTGLCRESEELHTSNVRMRKDLMACLGAKGVHQDTPCTAGLQTTLSAIQTSHELKSQVERLRRELSEYRRKAEAERSAVGADRGLFQQAYAMPMQPRDSYRQIKPLHPYEDLSYEDSDGVSFSPARPAGQGVEGPEQGIHKHPQQSSSGERHKTFTIEAREYTQPLSARMGLQAEVDSRGKQIQEEDEKRRQAAMLEEDRKWLEEDRKKREEEERERRRREDRERAAEEERAQLRNRLAEEQAETERRQKQEEEDAQQRRRQEEDAAAAAAAAEDARRRDEEEEERQHRDRFEAEEEERRRLQVEEEERRRLQDEEEERRRLQDEEERARRQEEEQREAAAAAEAKAEADEEAERQRLVKEEEERQEQMSRLEEYRKRKEEERIKREQEEAELAAAEADNISAPSDNSDLSAPIDDLYEDDDFIDDIVSLPDELADMPSGDSVFG